GGLGIDRDEQFHDLARIETIEQNGRDLDAEVFASLRQGVKRQQAVLAVEHSEHAVLFRDLEEPEIVLARHRREGEALLRRDDDRAWNGGGGGPRPSVPGGGGQLVELSPGPPSPVGGLPPRGSPLPHLPLPPPP